jgi:hypothetical protein
VIAEAKQTAAKAKALEPTSSEVIASIALPAASCRDAGSEAAGERSEGVHGGPGGREAIADHPSLFPHAGLFPRTGREQVLPASGHTVTAAYRANVSPLQWHG